IIYIQRDGNELFQSYEDLLTQAQRINAGLKKLGLQPQDKVILQIKNPQDFIPAFWGCILGGFVPVPLAIAPTYSQVNNAVNKLHNAWQMLEKPIILASIELVEAIASLSGLLGLENFQVESCDRLHEYDPDPSYHLSQPDDLAILLLTSGSTGMPKGVMLSHWNILSSVAATSQVSQLTQEDISLNWLPLDHPGPLIRCCIRCVFLGCEQIHAPTDVVLHQPLTWFDLLERYQVTTTWSPNFAFTLVNEQSDEIKQRKWNLSAVRSLLNTAEPIVPQTAQRFWELFQPHQLSASAMHSSWGMAETSSGVTFSDKFLSENPTSIFAELGLPIPGVSLRIVSSENQVLEEGTVGYLQVKGESVTQGYYNNSQLNGEVFTTDGWFATGDLGFLQAGRLTITGRQKDVIIINGANYYSHEIEAVVEKIPDIEVSYTAAVSVERDKLAIFFSSPLADNERLLREKLEEIQQQVVSQIGIKPDYLLPVDKTAIPKTSIGKIQRSQLCQQLETGEFNSILKKVDILLENAKTIPDWFYRQVWQTKQVRRLTVSTGPTLVFIDPLGLGDYIGEQLTQENQSCIKVSVGSVFAKISDDSYSINPERAEDYQLLLESITAKQKYIEQIIHLWNYSKYKGEISSLAELETAQNTGVYSLLFLVQALAKVQGEQNPVKLLFISSHTQLTETTEEIAYEKSSVLGLLKTIPQEMPWLNCRHIDLYVDLVEVNGDYILAEMQDITGEREVAYRKGQRLVPRLLRVNWESEFKQPLPFKTGGSYLITGGLGGIGVEIAKYLLENYHARLLLVGRTPLLAEKLAAFEQLQQLNGTVVYETVDICDRPGMEVIISALGELDGIIHLAGVARESLIESETQTGLATALRSKVSGTWVLHQLIKDKPDSIFINFSSINGFFGGTTVGAYAAANSFLDAFSDCQRTRSSLQSYCFAWSMWDETGMSRGYEMKQLSRDRGYYAIEKQQGIYAFLAGMSLEPTRLTIGIDGNKANIQRYQSECDSCEKLIAYFTGTVPAIPQTLCDRFGTPTTCQLQLVEEMPLTDSGEIDLHKLVGKIIPHKGERVAPRNDVEREIAKIWEDVLGVENVGIYDNFFQLGGHSLRALQVMYRLQNKFSVDLPLQNLFKTPNIAGLAATIGQQHQEQPFSCLVPIQPKGNRSPFFCVHPVGGNVLCYADLARHLGDEQPFYGLQSVGLNGEQEPMTCVEDMATHYIKAIQTIQPTGPYYIGGWSLGGAIAFEIAQQLSVSGQEVALLALLDSYTPKVIDQVSEQRKRILSQKSSVRVLDDATLASYYFAQDLGSLLGKELVVSLAQLQELELDAQLTYILEQAKTAIVLPPELELAQIRRLFQVFQANIQARLRYRPQPYTGSIVLFCASVQPEEMTADSSGGWDTLAIGGLEKHLIYGGHYQLVKSPKLAEKLNQYIT
ncbi:SDR family NAD(P)-dependent oxidoreductase, partial [Brasilonema bromeliae]